MSHVMKLSAVALLAIGAGCGTDDSCPDVSGTACTWAGQPGHPGINSPANGVDRRSALLYYPFDVTFAPDGRAYILDWNNHQVRRVNSDDTLTTVIGTVYEGDGPPDQSDRLPVGAPPGAQGDIVSLNHPTEVRFMPDGTTAVLAAWHNNKIRTLDTTTGIVKVLMGNSYGFGGDGGPAYLGLLNTPRSIAIASDGTIYIADERNLRIREIAPDGTVTTIAGTGSAGDTGDGGAALAATFGFDTTTAPWPDGAIALRNDTELFVADSLNNAIRKIDLTTGIITCVAGQSTMAGYSGDGGSALAAQLNYPNKLEFGPDGRLYVADRQNNAIRAIDVDNDVIETVAGNGKQCADITNCYAHDEGVAALDVQLDLPNGIGFDAAGNMYIGDTLNSRILRIAK